MEEPSTSTQIFGIQELYRPKTPIELDIIAIHGLNGDALKAWTSESATQSVNWLCHADFLPRYLENARVLTWGYNANLSSFRRSRPAVSSDRIMHHAQTLVSQLQTDRALEGTADRPIVFICHSLGGIIVKRALAYSASRTAPGLAHLHSIYTCTFGILFFGTPHLGASKARLLGSLQKLASIAVPAKALQIESNLVSALEEESETLQNITDQFAPLMSNFRIFFFWEQEKTDLIYTKDYIVDHTSAAPILDNTERSGIAANHTGMCKFTKSSDQGFRTVVAALRRYKLEAPEVIKGRMIRASAALNDRRWHEATELVKGAQELPHNSSRSIPATNIQGWTGRGRALFSSGEMVAEDGVKRVTIAREQES